MSCRQQQTQQTASELVAPQSGYKADTFGYYRVVFTKAQVVDLVGNVKVTHCKGHQVMHVHVGMLEAPPWGKVKVSSHLFGKQGAQQQT